MSGTIDCGRIIGYGERVSGKRVFWVVVDLGKFRASLKTLGCDNLCLSVGIPGVRIMTPEEIINFWQECRAERS